MKKISDLLSAYITTSWITALLLCIYAADKMTASWSMLVVLLIAVFFFVMGFIGTLAMGPLKEMEER